MVTLATPAPSSEHRGSRRPPLSPDRAEPIAPGAAIEVHTHFDGRWARGFEVIAVVDEGYRVRRLSDGVELPTVFTFDDIRPHRDRRRDTWWY